MSSKEILAKAIQKAIDNGWSYPFGANTYEIHKYVQSRPESIAFGLREGWQDIDDPGHLEGHWSIQELIFNHDFAKALWGEELTHETFIVPKELNKRFAGTSSLAIKANWQYHLQQMVIADDLVKYIGDNLDD